MEEEKQEEMRKRLPRFTFPHYPDSLPVFERAEIVRGIERTLCHVAGINENDNIMCNSNSFGGGLPVQLCEYIPIKEIDGYDVI